MPIEQRLIHRLVVRRAVAQLDDEGEPALDEYGHPVRSWVTFPPVMGLPQPGLGSQATIREVPAVSQAGPVVGEWVIFLLPIDVAEADEIVHHAAQCPVAVADLPDLTWQLTGVKNAAGVGHHFEVTARTVTAGEQPADPVSDPGS